MRPGCTSFAGRQGGAGVLEKWPQPRAGAAALGWSSRYRVGWRVVRLTAPFREGMPKRNRVLFGLCFPGYVCFRAVRIVATLGIIELKTKGK